ncbi:voltage-gated hydrogen channel 1 [Sphaerodactylus townsendi]|uniref:Voltage-gated hydrogen channel 1 n=1 Tax=Sphaerodactylus townsendi TaxID=933632 RepID=A0ACB8FZF9_9SAUR|nr:voltage-gated hydrogen channel 1 [Sphaerodactylus townsendi]XP_048370075.1 voltage-gated hydrogen channel 1 [Sphaerodactylus townsendi]
MSAYLKHFTVVGDDPAQWNNDYKKWEEEEMEVESGAQPAVSTIKMEPAPRPPTFREVMRKLFQSHKFQILVVCLVILDAVLVLAELLLDLKIIHPDEHEIVPEVFHYLSLSILTLFLVEVSFKLFTYRLEFFHHKFEVLDAIVVVISFVLDIVVLFLKHDFEAFGLLILLRLWRVARIINGIILSVKTRSEQQISKLKTANLQLTTKVEQLESSCAEKQLEIERLTHTLRQHGLLAQPNPARPSPPAQRSSPSPILS